MKLAIGSIISRRGRGGGLKLFLLLLLLLLLERVES